MSLPSVIRSKITPENADYIYFNCDPHVMQDIENVPMNGFICLETISQLYSITKFVNTRPDCRFVIIDIANIECQLKPLQKKGFKIDFFKILETNGKEAFEAYSNLYNIIYKKYNMKFDLIIMNPPYTGGKGVPNLHLDIVNIAMDYLAGPGSSIINLSPIRWLQDPRNNYRHDKSCAYVKYSRIVDHLNSLKVISALDAEKLFNTAFPYNLGIYDIKNYKTNFNLIKTFFDSNIYSLLFKILDQVNNKNNIKKQIKDIVPCKTSIIFSTFGGGNNGRNDTWDGNIFEKPFEHYCYVNNKNIKTGQSYYEYRKSICWGNNKPKDHNTLVVFDNINYAKNFVNSLRTEFYRFIIRFLQVDINIHAEYIPWLGDKINPRTGLKGYESEWTNEDLCIVFNLTKQDQDLIELEMKKFN